MLRFFIFSILWTIFVIVISLVPSSNVEFVEFPFEGVDKVVHFTMYSLFSLFWITGMKRQNVSKSIHKKAFLISLLGGFLLSLILEILQEFVTYTRHFEALDLLANGLGLIFGVVLFKIIYKDYTR